MKIKWLLFSENTSEIKGWEESERKAGRWREKIKQICRKGKQSIKIIIKKTVRLGWLRHMMYNTYISISKYYHTNIYRKLI